MFLNKNTKNVKPYTVTSHKAWSLKDEEFILKLDWNESTISPSPLVKEKIFEYLNTNKLNWYPNVCNHELKDKLSKYVNLPKEYVEYFSSSDALQEYILRAFMHQDDDLVIVSPTYDNFRAVSESFGVINHHFTLDRMDDFNFDIDKFIDYVEVISPKCIYICNPNNPTGNSYSSKDLVYLIRRFNDVLFIVDEAYFEFTKLTVASYVNEFENLIVCRTFSKAFGLASIRFGYLISSKNNIKGICKIRNPKSVNTFAQVAANAALDDLQYMWDYVSKVNETKDYVFNEMKKMGIAIFPSHGGNYIFVDLADNSGAIVKNLERNNVFVRSFAHIPGSEGLVRITIGARQQMEQFLEIFKKVITHVK